MKSRSNIVQGAVVSAKVDSFLKLDNGRCNLLLNCDDWDGADFRFYCVAGALAVNVHVTGRTMQWRGGW